MARENDLDPEDDFTIDGSQSLNFTFKSRVVVRDCTNYGTVTAKKENAGGIVGSMEMGSAISCYGLAPWTPWTPSVGRRGWFQQVDRARKRRQVPPSGSKQVGGIVGSGKTVENCRAMVVIDTATEQMGAIAGYVEDPLGGDVTGNNSWTRAPPHRRRELRWHRRADEL